MSKPRAEITVWIDKADTADLYRVRLQLPTGQEAIGTDLYPSIEAAKNALAGLANELDAELHYAN